MFEYNYEDFEAHFGPWNDKIGDVNSELKYLTPFGFCLSWSLLKNEVTLSSKESTSVFIIDPTYSNDLVLLGSKSVKLNFGSLGNGFYSGYKYEVQITLHDERINDGLSCIDYDRIDSSYGECIEDRMRKNMLMELGCLLPWVPDAANSSCENVKNLKMPEVFHKEISKFVYGWKIKSLLMCKQPCLRLGFKEVEIIKVLNKKNYGYAEILFYDEVKVYTDVFAYDMFSLVVDLGSALGLWLGLSALNLFSSLVDYTALARSQYFH